MEIVPAGAGGVELDPILQDYRRRYHLSENVVLSALLDALTSRRAQALVALWNGRPAGAVVLSQREAEGQIRLLHALEEAPAAGTALLEHAEERLRQGGALYITGSLPLSPADRLVDILQERGYQVICRERRTLDLVGALSLPAVDLAPGYRLVSWQEPCKEAAAVLIEEAHRDSADSALYPDTAGLEGAQRLIQRAVDGYYGAFDPAVARMALWAGTLVGLALNAWHAALPGQGFLLDLAVTAAHRRQGLGRALVVATVQAFQQAGAAVLGLAVTLSNRPAVALYDALGFQVEQYFTVLRKDFAP